MKYIFCFDPMNYVFFVVASAVMFTSSRGGNSGFFWSFVATLSINIDLKKYTNKQILFARAFPMPDVHKNSC